MSERFTFEENGIQLVLQVAGDGDVWLLHCADTPYQPGGISKEAQKACRLLEVQCAGFNQDGHHGTRHTDTQPAARMRYISHQDVRTPQGRKLMITQAWEGLIATSFLQFYDGIAALRSWTVVRNSGSTPYTLTHVTSFALTGIGASAAPCREDALYIAGNAWCGEAQWQRRSLADWGLHPIAPQSTNRIARAGTGTWPCAEHLPMGCYAHAQGALLWQIEHNGSWQWEVGLTGGRPALQMGGPSWQENHWRRVLEPGDSFTSVPAAIAFGRDFDEAVGAMTRYRRTIRRPSRDNETLPVIFNDWQRCIGGDPTTAKELPMIEAAAALGCETYVMDAGWYSTGSWWDGVGEWQPAQARFPGGIGEVLGAMREQGMTPGLWLELEVMGIHCPLATRVGKDWFFQTDGRPVIDHSRYQLDFRNPEVVNHADAVIDRLVGQEGVGYLKMDYNINAGPGTEHNAHSAGDGLLEHNRAYLAWLDRVFARYPRLVMESCASGGQRMEYATLSRCALQSVTDQTDPRLAAVIAAATPSAVTPEQAGMWCAPVAGEDDEAVVFSVVNALLLRMHVSGGLLELSPSGRALLAEGVACYKGLRAHIAQALPLWPLGLPSFDAPWVSLGLAHGDTLYLAVWRMETGETGAAACDVPLPRWQGKALTAACVYPSIAREAPQWDAQAGTLRVTHPRGGTARVYALTRA